MKKARPKNANKGLKKSRKIIEERQAEEKQIQPVMAIRDLNHARSAEVTEWCIKELAKGTTWNGLRRKLGLGPAHIDKRWRALREHLCQAILPETEEEALQALYSTNEFLLEKLEKFAEYVEERARNSRGEDNEHMMLKVQLEAMKLQLEKNEAKFSQFMEIRRLKSQERRKTGRSIIYQNNYIIPRPGEAIEDVTDKTTKLVVEMNKAGSA